MRDDLFFSPNDLVAVGSGTSGTTAFQLDLLQLFDVDYRIIVQPTVAWTDCSNSYSLSFSIP